MTALIMLKRLILPAFLLMLICTIVVHTQKGHKSEPAFLSVLTGGAALAAPPTVDPTYGFPLPSRMAPALPAAPAQWIWVAQTQGTQTVSARAAVTLSAAPRSATLFVTADDAATVYVNGHRLIATNPAENQWRQVQRQPVAPLLHAGQNVVAMQGVNSGGAAGILAQLEVDGKIVLQSGAHWKVLESPVPPTAWTETAFDDSGWQAATALAPVGQGPWGTGLINWPGQDADAWYLAHVTVPPVRTEAVSGQISGGPASGLSVKAVAAGDQPAALRVDFGREIAGRLLLQGTPGTALHVTTGETLAELTRTEPALDNSGPYDLALTAGKPVATSYSAFRYALIVLPSRQAATLTQIACDHKYYPVAYKGSFACSDPLLTKIWYAGAYTAHLCMQEDIWDAPKRDRGLWGGDLHVTGATINNVFADTFLMERSIGRLPKIASGGAYNPALAAQDINDLPGYTASWFCTLADFYRHAGDQDFLKSQHQTLLALLDYQQGEFDTNSLFVNSRKKWSFVDWSPDFVLDSPQSHMAIDLFDIKGIREAVFLLREIGDTRNADKYETWANTLTDAAQKNYPDPSALTYGNRLQTNIMAVYSGVASPAQKQAIYAHILRAGSPAWTPPVDPKSTSAYPMSPYYGHYALQVLGEMNRQQDGVDLIRRYWGAMMARGTTTLWEQFDPSMPADMNQILNWTPYLSFSHGWSTGPTSFLSEYVLGVRPTSGGMKTVEIVPFLGDLSFIDGAVPAPQGLIRVKASKSGGLEAVTLGLPAGVDAQVGLPGRSVSVNGKPCPVLRRADGVSYVRLAQAGVYHLQSSSATGRQAQAIKEN